MRPVKALNAIFLASYPAGSEIDGWPWFRKRGVGLSEDPGEHRQTPLSAETQAAVQALRQIESGVREGKIKIRGVFRLGEALADIDPEDATDGRLDVFAETLEIPERGHAYQSVRCVDDDVFALLGMPSTASRKLWKNPTDEMVRIKLRVAYSEAKAAGARAPNINKIPKFGRPKLNADGYDASDARIKKIAEQPEFEALREPTGVRAT
jgi:hypothetical protein